MIAVRREDVFRAMVLRLLGLPEGSTYAQALRAVRKVPSRGDAEITPAEREQIRAQLDEVEAGMAGCLELEAAELAARAARAKVAWMTLEQEAARATVRAVRARELAQERAAKGGLK